MNVKRLFMAAALLLLMAISWSVTGCGTWTGLGKDIERTGEEMQD